MGDNKHSGVGENKHSGVGGRNNEPSHEVCSMVLSDQRNTPLHPVFP